MYKRMFAITLVLTLCLTATTPRFAVSEEALLSSPVEDWVEEVQGELGEDGGLLFQGAEEEPEVPVSENVEPEARELECFDITGTDFSDLNQAGYAAEGAVLELSTRSLELFMGQSTRVSIVRMPDQAGAITWFIEKTDVATVSPEGIVTARSVGIALLEVWTESGATAQCQIVVRDLSAAVILDSALYALGVGQKAQIIATLAEGFSSELHWSVENPSIATVSADGLLTANKAGQTTVTVKIDDSDVGVSADVVVRPAPSSVALSEDTVPLLVGETYAVHPMLPEGTAAEFSWQSSDEKCVSVSPDGVATAVQQGTASVTVTTYNGCKAVLKVSVTDPNYPETLQLNATQTLMNVGDTFQTFCSYTPSTAMLEPVWQSSNPDTAVVDEVGRVTAVGQGYAVISVTSQRNTSLKASFIVTVQSRDLAFEIPARITDIAGISANLKKIEAIHRSALREIDRLSQGGVIEAKDADKRRSIIDNAFRIYAFPWMTPAYQGYWKAENSEGGLKDFKPGNVYYGLPYISGSDGNRNYNVDKALSEARYLDSGSGYYLLNQKKLLDKKYVGNDCSGLCAVCIWGTSNKQRTVDRTNVIATNSAYKNVSYAALRPGDMICKTYSHVVFFLYYVDAAQTRVMIMENGGSDDLTNTVHCSIYDVSYYKNRGYVPRRLASLP